MPRSFAETMLSERISSNLPILSPLPIPDTNSPIPPPPTQPKIQGFPFNNILDTTNSRIIGDIALFPHSYHFAPQPLTPAQVLDLPLEEQVWDFGYVLDPEYAGKGIMSEVVGCIVEGWVEGWMGIGSVGAVSGDMDTDTCKLGKS
jgi:hypothetical protein